MRIALAVAAISVATRLAAQEPFLTLPLDCDYGRTCYVEDYVDADPTPDQADYACGIKSRDGHRGTDFALTSQAQFAQGVSVIAAAPGTVAATRDGMPDLSYDPENADAVEGRECGNAVRISHENGLETLYCHMARDSVQVRTGDVVERGDVLGRVGMSGQTNYPHLHLGVLGPDGRLDPFAPQARETCDPEGPSLWLDAIPYTETGMFTAGFSDRVPAFADVKSGSARLTNSATNAPLVLYSHFFHARSGDRLSLRVTGPDGSEIFASDAALTDPKASQFSAYGRKAPPDGWPKGRYTGTATLTRGDQVLGVRFTEIDIR